MSKTLPEENFDLNFNQFERFVDNLNLTDDSFDCDNFQIIRTNQDGVNVYSFMIEDNDNRQQIILRFSDSDRYETYAKRRIIQELNKAKWENNEVSEALDIALDPNPVLETRGFERAGGRDGGHHRTPR